MKYDETVFLKDGRACRLRNGTEQDGVSALANYVLTHEQTDYLLTYPDENVMTAERESQFLKEKAESADEIELLAEDEGVVVGLAGVSRVGNAAKVRRRAEFGISIVRTYWRQGIGRALTRACVASARRAGYAQLELAVVAENSAAIALYRSEGFVEYGRNPRGFYSRYSGWQELVLMRLELR